MKYKDIKLLSLKECNEKLQEQSNYLVRLKFTHAVSPIEHPMKIREVRRSVARLKTAQNQFFKKQSEA